MRLAVVGAGNHCMFLMDIIEKYEFKVVSPEIVAVADINDDAPGLVKAREKGLIVSNDYNDFFKLDNIDLIVELTGNLDIYNDIISKKNDRVRAIAHTTAGLFWEIDTAAKQSAKANQKLSESQAIYNSMINGLILENVMVIDLDYKIMDINKTYLERLGLTREQVIGHYCHEITHHQTVPCSGKEHPCPLAEVRETGKSSRATHVHITNDGRKHYVSISCYPFIQNGEFKGVIELSKDITNDIEFEKNMMQQEKLVSIGRLSAGVAHEINNPLTTILTSAMLMREDFEEGTEMFDELTTISKETLRCRKIVKSLLDFARQSKSSKRPDSLNEVLKESMVLTRKQANFKNIELKSMLSKKLPPVSIDRDQIQQTIINLTLNAIEATPSGGTITLTSAHSSDKKAVLISVKDTGEGIEAQDLNKIFDPFFTTKKTGTGLGLTITHGIIEQHGGTISVESTVGKGTEFNITFPAVKSDENGQ